MKKIPILLSIIWLLVSGCSLFYQPFDTNRKVTESDRQKSKEIAKESEKKLSEGHRVEAEDLMKQAYELNKGDTSTYIQLARTLAKTGNAQNCLESLLMINDLIEQDPKNASLYRTKIEILKYCDFRILTTLGFADRTYEDLLAADSTNQDALFFLAVRDHLFWLNNRNTKSMKQLSGESYDKSLNYYRKLYQYYPDFVPGIHGLIQLYQDSYLNYYIPDMVNRAVIDYPNATELWLDLATFYYSEARGRISYYKKSDECFKRAFGLMDSLQKLDYFQIQHFLSGKELEEFEESGNKFESAQKYFRKTTPFFLNGFNEFELDHYNRVWYAKNHFFVPSRNTDGDKTDRGKLYIAYGEPDGIITVRSANAAYDDSLTSSQYVASPSEAFDSQIFETAGAPESFGETASDTRQKENYERWLYGDFELKFTYSRNKSDYIYEEPRSQQTSLKAKGNFIIPHFNKRKIEIRTKYLLEEIDSLHSKVIAYFAVPINKRSSFKKSFSIKLEEGLFFHDMNYSLSASKKGNLPLFYPEAIIEDSHDSVFAVQKSSMVVPTGKYHFSHEIWLKNTDQVFIRKEEFEINPLPKNSVILENIILIYRPVYEIPENELKDIPEYLHFLPVFDDKLKKGEKAKLFFKVVNTGEEEFHNYLFQWSLQRVSSGFFSGIGDMLTQRNTSTSVEYDYSRKSRNFSDAWEIDTRSLSTGNYVITLEVVDKLSRKRDRKTYSFEVVD